MAGNMVAKAAVACVLALSFGVSHAVEIPKASGKALGVTKGRQFDAGLVFINGKFIEPPYVVERRGVGICINGIPAVAQVVEWAEFLKTQQGVKVIKTETPAPAYAFAAGFLAAAVVFAAGLADVFEVDFCADFAIRASALAAREDLVVFVSAIFSPRDKNPYPIIKYIINLELPQPF